MGAFTLVEILISVSLLALVLGAAYACLQAGFAARQVIEPRADVLQTARVAMGLLAADLRNACPLSGDSEFIGMQRTLEGVQFSNIDFATHNYRPAKRGEGDYCEISIFVDNDPETGALSLWRRRNPRIGMDPLAGGKREQLASGVRGLSFEFYDGIDWYDTWGAPDARRKYEGSARYRGNISGLPEAVRISLSLDNERQSAPSAGDTNPRRSAALVFRTVVMLNLARSAARSAVSSATNSASGSQQPTPQSPSAPGFPQ
jgi:type II secretory pathway pseudopilin PulG